MKVCTKCGIEKPPQEFPGNGGGRPRPECKACLRERVHEWRERNPERAKEIRRAFYARNREAILAQLKTPEARARAAERARTRRAKNATPRPPALTAEEKAARRRGRYQANRDRILAGRREKRRQDPEGRARAAAVAKAWREKYPERFNDGREKWRRENWNKVLDGNARRRAQISTTQVERFSRSAVYERDGGRCHICGRRVGRTDFVLDHLIPLSKGGPHTFENVATAHARCNSRRGPGRLPAQLRLSLEEGARAA